MGLKHVTPMRTSQIMVMDGDGVVLLINICRFNELTVKAVSIKLTAAWHCTMRDRADSTHNSTINTVVEIMLKQPAIRQQHKQQKKAWSQNLHFYFALTCSSRKCSYSTAIKWAQLTIFFKSRKTRFVIKVLAFCQ